VNTVVLLKDMQVTGHNRLARNIWCPMKLRGGGRTF
jgi:hypothetical protein